MKTHDLKIYPRFFEPVLTGEKKAELRRDDRGYAVGDILNLKEWDPSGIGPGFYTGREIKVRVTHIIDGSVSMGMFHDMRVLSIEHVH